MASASGIRMGKVFVEIGADPAKFFAAVRTIEKQIGRMGQFSDRVATSMRSMGTGLAAIGAAATAPLALAIRQSTAFDNALRNITASTGATAAQIDQIRVAAMGMSQEMGIGPTAITQAFLQLLKAGMPLEQVLGGAGKAATQFAKVGEMAVADAAVVMADAMKVFGVDAATAANTISSAADASSTDIHNLSIAFSQVSAVAGLANQSIHDTATALAIMANAGVKGSDAGTSLKTMLLRLMAPTEESAKALAAIGLSTESFRGADGRIMPLVKIIGTLQRALAGVDQATQDNIFRDVFGQDAIRAAAILTQTGAEGFGKMQTAMGGSLTVGQKFSTLMGGVSGAVEAASGSFERLQVAVGDQLAGGFAAFLRFAGNAASMLTEFVRGNGEAVVTFSKAAVAVSAAGAAVLGFGAALGAVNFAVGSIGAAFSLFLAPIGAVVVALGGVALSFIIATVKAVAYGVASVSAAVASGAAFAAANIVMVSAIGGVVVILGMLIASLFHSIDVIGSMNKALGAIKDVASGAVATLAELGKIGRDTFAGIYDAINAGDSASAMSIAMAGLKSAFTTGATAFMNEVDKWGVNLVDSFDYYLSKIPFLRFLGPDQYTFSVFGDSGASPAFGAGGDQEGRGLDRRLGLVQRRMERNRQVPGAQAGLDDALRQSREVNVFRAQANDVIQSASVAATFDALRLLSEEFHALAATGKLSSDQLKRYSEAVDTATDRLSENTVAAGDAMSPDGLRKRRESLAMDSQASDLLKNVGKAQTMDDLQSLQEEFDALKEFGRLSGDQESAISNAIMQATALLQGPSRQSQAEVAGTFSSMAIGGMGFGSSIAQKQLEEQKKTNKILEDKLGDEGAVAA